MIIILCVRWYLRYSLSYRDLEEMMVERGLSVDHVTIWRWVQRYAPILNQRLRRERRDPNRSWRVDETYVRGCQQLDVPLPSRGFRWRYHRFHVVTEAGSDCRQAIPAFGIIRNWRGPAEGGQCGWTRGVRTRHRRAEAIGRTQSALSLPAVALLKQHH